MLYNYNKGDIAYFVFYKEVQMGKIEITHEIENQCCVRRGVKGVPAPIPQEGEWTKCKEIKDISGLTHGCGCCAPQQGTCPSHPLSSARVQPRLIQGIRRRDGVGDLFI